MPVFNRDTEPYTIVEIGKNLFNTNAIDNSKINWDITNDPVELKKFYSKIDVAELSRIIIKSKNDRWLKLAGDDQYKVQIYEKFIRDEWEKKKKGTPSEKDDDQRKIIKDIEKDNYLSLIRKFKKLLDENKNNITQFKNLTLENNEDKIKIKALIFSIYQVRCNMFHGGKQFHKEHWYRNYTLVKESQQVLEELLKLLLKKN